MPPRPRTALAPLHHALRSALFGTALGLAAVPPGLLAATPRDSAGLQRYAIAAGPLGDALNQFARRAGITLAATPQQTAGKTSPGLQGEYQVHDGLAQLLRGTDLEALDQGNGSFSLGQRADAAGALQLDTTAISSTGLSGTTEGSGAYTTGAVSIGKTPQSLRRTPHSVSVLTEQRLKDQDLTTLTQMLQQTPGVVVDYTDSERVNYYTRGYQIDALQFDGMSIGQDTGDGNFIQSDAATLDHIEVLRGATGMLRGAGNPSGTVNMVRKRPTREFQGSVSYTLGSWDANRYVADVSGPLLEGGALRGRMIAVQDDKDFFQDTRMERKTVFYTALAADLSDRTSLTGGLEYTELDATGAWGGLPSNVDGSAMNLPRDTFLGANWGRWDRTNLHLFTELEQRFDNQWALRLSASRARLAYKDHGFQQTYIYRNASNPALFDVSATLSDGGGATVTDNLQVVADGPFQLLGREHHLTVGAEHSRVDHTGTQTGFTVVQSGIDIRHWNPSAVPRPAVTYGPSNTALTTQQGIHATASFSLGEPLTALIGARVNRWQTESTVGVSGVRSAYGLDNQVVPYAALVLDLTDQISTYASYTEIFRAQNAYTESGDLIDEPVKGDLYEIGVKGEFYAGRLNTSASLFRTTLTGAAVDDQGSRSPCTPYYDRGYCQAPGGKSRSQGIELEVSGEVRPHWHVTGGYTYTQTRYLKDATSNTGNVLRTTDPQHLLRLFTRYRLPGPLAAWTVGAGVQAQSGIYAVSGSARSEQGGYALYNAMVGYRFNDHYSLQFNANNLFDTSYYEKIGSGVNYYYGEPRHYALTLRGEF